jgi:2-(1,2-epoxy-1,2-dihydrophenyl)acetyl-CoA isomerase
MLGARGQRDGLVNAWSSTASLTTSSPTGLPAGAGPTIALQMTKRMLASASSLSFAEALGWEATAQAVNFASSDTREGVAAFLEKRPPVFRGR